MNKPFEKHVKHFSAAVASVLADQKSTIRTAGVKTLADMATACEGIDPLVHGLSTSLETQNPLLRSSLLSWLGSWFAEHPPTPQLDLASWVAPVISCLDDRSGDVRKGAQAVLPHIITSVGYNKVASEVNNLKPASRSTIQPILQALRPTPAAAPSTAPTPTPKPASPVPPPMATTTTKAVSVPPSALSGVSKMGGLRGRKIGGTSLARTEPTGGVETDHTVGRAAAAPMPKVNSTPLVPVAAATSQVSSDVQACPFIGSNLEIKKGRLAKDGNRWVIEGLPVRRELVEALHSQMDGRVSPHLLSLLFSGDHNAINDFMAGMTNIVDCYSRATNTAGKAALGSTKKL